MCCFGFAVCICLRCSSQWATGFWLFDDYWSGFGIIWLVIIDVAGDETIAMCQSRSEKNWTMGDHWTLIWWSRFLTKEVCWGHFTHTHNTNRLVPCFLPMRLWRLLPFDKSFQWLSAGWAGAEGTERHRTNNRIRVQGLMPVPIQPLPLAEHHYRIWGPV